MKRFLISACIAAASAAGFAHADEAAVRQALGKRFPSMKIESIGKSTVPGFFEVFTGTGEIIYVDDKGSYMFAGTLIDIGRGVNLTDERMSKLTFVKFADLPMASSFKIVRGKGTRRVAYFADPNCGYCKKLEQDLIKLDDITIHVFPIPILSADSVDKAKSIWCSKDKGKAWLDWMLNGVPPTGGTSCDTAAIDKALDFARQKGVSGTPTLFFPNDQRVVGVVPVAQLEQLWNSPPAKR